MRQTAFACVFVLAGIFTTLCAQDYPYQVPCGEVTSLTLSENVPLDKWDVPKFKEKPTLQFQKLPIRRFLIFSNPRGKVTRAPVRFLRN